MAKRFIKNTNGKTYELLESRKNYALLYDALLVEYIVVWDLKEFENGWSWGQGHYFQCGENAVEYFRERV